MGEFMGGADAPPYPFYPSGATGRPGFYPRFTHADTTSTKIYARKMTFSRLNMRTASASAAAA